MRFSLTRLAATFLYDVSIFIIEIGATIFGIAFGKEKLRNQQFGKLQSCKLLLKKSCLQGCYWFHAVSLGEIKLAETMAAKIRAHDKNCRIIVTVITQTGYNHAASRSDIFDLAMYYPADLSFFMKRFLKIFQPRALIVVEGDLWPNQIVQASKSGIPVLIANGRISEATTRWYERLSFLGRRLLSHIDFVFAQTDVFADRFRRSGVLPTRVTVSGNIKFGGDAIDLSAQERDAIRKKWNLPQAVTAITFGSVHPDEMSELAKAIRYLDSIIPDLAFIIVPRHPELFSDLDIYESMGLRGHDYLCRESVHQYDDLVPVSFVRKLGVLKELYAISDLGFVGGTFCAVNGHNLIEPALCGIPVLFGPAVREQQVLRDAVIRFGAGHQAQDGAELGKALQQYVEDKELYARTRENARRMIESMGEVAEKVVREIRYWNSAGSSC